MSYSRMTSYRCSINGAAALLFITILGGSTAHGGETTLYNFHKFGGAKAGALPRGALIEDGSGNLYGTTEEGGGGACANNHGCGVVFKLSPRGKETVLYAFAGGNDGAFPGAGVISDNAGNLYGTTGAGGSTACQEAYGGCGTVFKLAPDGTKSVLYAFQGGSDGWQPLNSLVADGSGNLYGATGYGGNFDGSDCEQIGCGTVYEVQPNGTKLTLYDFQGGNDGNAPFGGVILDGAGNVYGTTFGGGSCGCGTVFKIAPDGTETVLYAFRGGADGAEPVGVTMDSSGNLYGATVEGGNCTIQFYADNCGTIYQLAPDGTKTVLYNFQGGDGLEPMNELVMDNVGNLYGTTFLGGAHGCKKGFGDGCGVVFEVTPAGKETVLYAFEYRRGANPYAPLLLDAQGELYGTTTEGGKGKDGVVFKLK